MIIISVDRDGLDRGTATRPFRVTDEASRVRHASEVQILGDSSLIYEPDAPLSDGTRVWIECERVRARLDPDDRFWLDIP